MRTTKRYDIAIRVSVDSSQLADCPPDPESLRETMLAANVNLEFQDLSQVTWGEVEETIDAEAEIIDDAMSQARDAQHLDELLEAADEYFRWEADVDGSQGSWLDLGTRGAVFALNAAGCPTFTSCAGHDDGRGPGFPYVAFYAPRRQGEFLVRAAKASDVGLVNSNGGLEVFSDRIEGLLAFAREICRGGNRPSGEA